MKALQGQEEAYFGQHPDAEILTSQPGLGPILGARVLARCRDIARKAERIQAVLRAAHLGQPAIVAAAYAASARALITVLATCA